MDDPMLLWIVGLLALGIGLFVLEVFIPSGGILGGCALLCGIIAIVLGFRMDSLTGLTVTLIVATAAPTMVWGAIKILPNTPMGRKIILSEGSTEEEMRRRQEERTREAEAYSSLIGARGTAITDLRPGGTIRIDNADLEGFAESGFIEAGTDVEVTRVTARQIRVKPLA